MVSRKGFRKENRYWFPQNEVVPLIVRGTVKVFKAFLCGFMKALKKGEGKFVDTFNYQECGFFLFCILIVPFQRAWRASPSFALNIF